MDIPLQVSFRNMDRSAAVEARVREKAANLEKYYDHLTSCRVVVEAPEQRHRKGDLFHVRIELGYLARSWSLAVTRRTSTPTRTFMSRSATPSTRHAVSWRTACVR